MNFGSPSWLWLSAATLFPILIHLWNNRSGRPIQIATFRFLPTDDLSKARSIQLHEVFLLLIRCAIIIALSLFLADPYYDSPIQTADVIRISEHKYNSSNSLNFLEDENKLSVSSELISQAGWWSLISQMEQDFPAKSYIVDGDLSSESFGNRRKSINADIVWTASDFYQAKRLVSESWFGVDGKSYQLVQQFDEANVKSEISPTSDTTTSALHMLLTIDNSLSDRSKEGILFVAKSWKIPTQESEIESAIEIQASGIIWKLELCTMDSEHEISAWIPPNSYTGLPLEIRTSDSLLNVNSSLPSFPLLSKADSTSFTLRGNVQSEIEAFVFAGIAQFLLQKAVGIEEYLSPTLPIEQRISSSHASKNEPIRTRKTSAQSWFLYALILLWMIERYVAPKRNM